MPAHNAQFCGMVNVNWGGGVRPAPICTGAETGVLVSSSCYHGYERVPQTLAPVSNHVPMELDYDASTEAQGTPPVLSRKRCGDDSEAPRVKRLREEHKENINQEEVEKKKGAEQAERKREDEAELERMLWNTHGTSWFHLQASNMAATGSSSVM